MILVLGFMHYELFFFAKIKSGFNTGWPKNLETWNNLEFDNLVKTKTWNLRNFEKKKDFF